jgi:hypothetical protein
MLQTGSPDIPLPLQKGQVKSGKGVLNTRRNSGEARLSGLCYLWGFLGKGFPVRKL